MKDPFEYLYLPDERDRRIFGERYKPETDRFEHGRDVIVCRLPATSADGQSVVVTEARLPARFFTAHVRASPDRQFEHVGRVKGKPAVVISTGSGDEAGRLLFQIAVAVSEGMLGIRLEGDEP